MHRINYLIIFGLAFSQLFNIVPRGEVLGATTKIVHAEEYVVNAVQLVTTTAFSQKEIVETQEIPYETIREKNEDLDYGTEEITQAGETGLKTFYYLITHWDDEEIDRKLTNTETVEPVDEIISEGTKITWRLLEGTEHGRLRYWHKMRVWATKYDANCVGCTGRTYSGTEVVKGVCATDPKVIPLGTNFYVEGYGLCRAEDIGGGIKGNMVDLGYKDVTKGEWRTGYTDVYLLSNAPE